MNHPGLILTFFLFFSVLVFAQDKNESGYFENYTDDLTTRLYSVVKYNSIQFIGKGEDQFVTYRPNSNVNLGFGFNYRGFGLNIGYPVKFLNDDEDKYGETRHFNADANSYSENFNLTAFFQFYKGYYQSSSNSNVLPREDTATTIRSDVGFYVIGGSGTYVFNKEKVSYRAAFTQDAWQKKSAGSALLGGYCTFSNTEADSSMILPFNVNDNKLDEIVESKSLDIGPLIGYMHSFVVKEHWFFTISVSAGVGLNKMWLKLSGSDSFLYSYNPNYRLQERIAFGYNSRRDYVGISYVNENSRAIHQSGRIGYNVGNLRFNLVHRFSVKKVPIVDNVMDWLDWAFMPRTDG